MLLTAILLATCSSAVSAQRRSGFYSNIEIQLLYDDNVRAVVDELKTSDKVSLINPVLDWILLIGKHQLDFQYKGNYGFYVDDSTLNHDDHRLTSRALLDHSHRLNSEFRLGYVRGHDPPGGRTRLRR